MLSRTDIKNFILDVESKFPVDKWEVNNIHIWPIVRLDLYFYLIRKLEIKKKQETEEESTTKISKQNVKFFSFSIFKEFYIQFKNYLKYKIWILSLKKKELFFLSHASNSGIYQNKNIIRFLDPLVWEFNLGEKVNLCLVGDENSNNSFNQQLRLDTNKYLYIYECQRKFFSRFFPTTKNQKYKLNNYSQYIKHLNNSINSGNNIENQLENIDSIAERFSFYSPFVKQILKKINPKNLILVGYYDHFLNHIFLAHANQLNINTIEVQHGPQTDIHLAYGSWSKLPEKGFNSMPKTFWCWEYESKKTIKNWSASNKYLDVFVGGNPWVNYFNKLENTNSKKIESYILYTLQPSPLSVEDLFLPKIIDFIKNKEFNWILRLHPLQQNEKEKLINFLKKEGILELITLHDSDFEPLPISLKNCLIHVTNFSGSAIEASLLNKKSIILHKTGEITYSSLIQKEQAFYLNPNDSDFEKNLEAKIQSVKNDSNFIETIIEIEKVKKYLCLT